MLDPELLAAMLGGRPAGALIDQLSAREREVISRMSEGRSNEALAREMNLSERAVEAHVADIFTKLALPPMGDDRRRMLAMLLSRSSRLTAHGVR